jgi:hypothetical protein
VQKRVASQEFENGMRACRQRPRSSGGHSSQQTLHRRTPRQSRTFCRRALDVNHVLFVAHPWILFFFAPMVSLAFDGSQPSKKFFGIARLTGRSALVSIRFS